MSRKKDKRGDFLEIIPLNTKRLLDVGCGDGGLSARLKERGIEVVGIEKIEKLCSIAKGKLNNVISGDIEKLQLPYPEGYFDCIMYADILEHLIEPLNILEKQKIYLQKDGYVIASIPNVRYYKVILRLILSGTWDYSDAGMLDKTHVRFFGLVNIVELFNRAGYSIIEIRRNIIAGRWLKILNVLFFNTLRDFLTYQYYVKARKDNNFSRESLTSRKIYKF
ncbi:MAG: class I SAM-dependent methyltransferase [Candidatus Omnitrophota bacterium]|jgi:SAM-dependent methyltransferase